eukprot:2608430-Rhodomonas_salina.2
MPAPHLSCPIPRKITATSQRQNRQGPPPRNERKKEEKKEKRENRIQNAEQNAECYTLKSEEREEGENVERERGDWVEGPRGDNA